MGQTLSLVALPGGSAGIDIPELSDLVYEKPLSAARFMKSVRARHRDGLVVVKVVMKPHSHVNLSPYIKAIRSDREALLGVPNALAYQRVFETSTNGYLVRQYCYSSLYDRMSTRPFLEDIEKRWLAYQLLCAVRDSHARGVFHGDIKSENVVVTSWNWLYLTDYSASYKQTYLPEDNPADFSYYFDTSGRRTCYLAPERFDNQANANGSGSVTWAMDVFSAGCVIAELFTETPIFNLSQLFKYKSGDYDPKYGYLDKILDPDVRELVSHMIQLQPESRYFAEEYLNFWRRKAFPEYFYSFLHQYMGSITDLSSAHAPVLPETTNFGDSDERIDKVYYDFDKISYFLGFEKRNATVQARWSQRDEVDMAIHRDKTYSSRRRRSASHAANPEDDGSLIFLTLITSSLRNTARSTARVRACDVMLELAERLTDEAKMDRVVPYIVALLNDRFDTVKIAAIRTLTRLLSMIELVSPVNAYAFNEYIKQRLQQFIGGPGLKSSPLVRATYASCIGSLAVSANRMLDTVQALQADGSILHRQGNSEGNLTIEAVQQGSYDRSKADLLDHFESHAKALLTDKHASVRRAFLGCVADICVFLGSARVNDAVLSHLNTYLNDKDWLLKCAFFRAIIGVGIFIGGPSLEAFILPLMTQALADAEEFVIRSVITSLAELASLGLFQRMTLWDLLHMISPFLMHPNMWIRESAAHFIAASNEHISLAERYCIVVPLIAPFFKILPTELETTALLSGLRTPLSLAVFEMAVQWAGRWRTSKVWLNVQQQRPESIITTGQLVQKTRPGTFFKLEKNAEDENWIKRLRSVGISSTDEQSVLALSSHILRLAIGRADSIDASSDSELERPILLSDLHLVPQTIFFQKAKIDDHTTRPQSSSVTQQRDRVTSNDAPLTITDALLDASTAMTGQSSQDTGVQRHRTQEYERLRPLSSVNIRRIRSSQDQSKFQNGESRSPSVSSKAPSLAEKLDMKHKSSAINLLNRREHSKTPAELSMNTANVMGEVKGSPREAQTGLEIVKNMSSHTYDGKDPTVTRLLDSLASEHYPRDIQDFGPLITSVNTQHKAGRQETIHSGHGWSPREILVGTFGEHSGPITRILPSADHLFFITGSEDGTVKIWDTMRLERNLAHRSRQTFIHAENAKVVALCFVENTYTFVSAASDGSIKVVKIVRSVLVKDNVKYERPRVLRHHRLNGGESATWLEHVKTDARSLLVLTTNQCRIIALNLKDMSEVFKFQNPVHYGIPLSFCIDPKQEWIAVGTAQGVLSLWDVRFHIRLRSWGFSGGKAINRVCLSPFKGQGHSVFIAGGTKESDISLWNVEDGSCWEVFASKLSRSSSRDLAKLYEATSVDDETTETMMRRFAADPDPDSIAQHARGACAFAVGIDVSDDRDNSTGFLITGGADKLLRYWNRGHVGSSMIISGLEAEDKQPRYSTIRPTTSLTIHAEKATSPYGPSAQNAATGTTTNPGTLRSSSNTLISMQQQTLLRNHLDEITDVCVLEYPVRMTVSVDRMGCIYVFQ